ncbi:MAG TPA: undecaprenyl-diphosphatase UppP [Bacteroidota bacterium]|nr:undecaprenyl-diphosphatase UppP [Bacteroidota bacterium]
MSTLHAILLGLIQGLSEFLPISSTAHLTIAGRFMGLIDYRHPEAWTAFIAILQLGTQSAMLVYFARDLWAIALSVIRDVATNGGGKGFAGYSRDSRLVLYMFIGTLPVAVVGLVFKDVIEGDLTKSILVIAYSMVLFGLILWLAEKSAQHVRSLSEVTWRDALVIGMAQVLALFPGASRSGTTITAALFLGFRRSAAARFSFLLSIPAVLASGLLELFKVAQIAQSGGHVMEFGVSNLVIATVVSAVMGYTAISWLLSYLIKNTTMVFVWYRLIVGTAILILIATGNIWPM